MKILLTAGPTHEPIDAVRYIGNRSSGRMGAAIAQAAMDAGDVVTLIAGPVSILIPEVSRRTNVLTAAMMHTLVLEEFPNHDLLIMAAAVADFRPTHVSDGKLSRADGLIIECEPTEDILSDASKLKSPNQRTVGFSLETLPRAVAELVGRPIGRVLTKMGKITREQVIEALDIQKKLGGLAGKILVELGYVTQDDVELALAAQRGHESTGYLGDPTSLPVGTDRARKKLIAKQLDMIVFNPAGTMDSGDVAATLLWPDGRAERLPMQSKPRFAATLIARCHSLFAD